MCADDLEPKIRRQTVAGAMSYSHGGGGRRHVVERRSVGGISAARGFGSHREGEGARQRRLRFELNAAQFRAASISEEKQRRR